MTIHRRNVDRPARPGRIAMAVLSIGAVVALSACGNGDNSSQNGTDSSAAAASSGDKGTAESSAAPTIKDVNDFRSGPSYLFTYEIDGGKKGECFVAETGLGCTGTVSKDVPDVVVPPFEQQRPGAVFANSEGPDYGIFEGVPPAKSPCSRGSGSPWVPRSALSPATSLNAGWASAVTTTASPSRALTAPSPR